jgi:hypothetical protein
VRGDKRSCHSFLAIDGGIMADRLELVAMLDERALDRVRLWESESQLRHRRRRARLDAASWPGGRTMDYSRRLDVFVYVR